MSDRKNLYQNETLEEVQQRIGRLSPECQGQWGTMSAAQAAAHCSLAMEWALGDRVPPRLFVGRILGGIIKPFVLREGVPMRRNVPTTKDLIVSEDRDLDAERARLSQLIDRFAREGPAGCTKRPHSFFGRLSPEEWAVLMYKHLDHHLRQFGV